VVISAHDGPCALLGADMNSDGTGYCQLNAPLDSALSGKALSSDRRSEVTAFNNLYMNGQEVFKFAVRSVPETLQKSLAQAGLDGSDVDWLVMHQANKRILDAAAKKLGMPSDKVVSNLAEYGNTSAASIPLALDEAVRGGKVSEGDVLALAGFGAGLTWASAIVRWR
jgi:3-oxoacyl-[acyl-carrier-protein] synthase III